ncbi:MAG: alpha/beta hydrolase [Exilibacterium sp.]
MEKKTKYHQFPFYSRNCFDVKFPSLVMILTLLIAISSSPHSNGAEMLPTATTFKVNVIGKGEPVILLPGLTSDQRVWQNLSAELSKTRQVHLINLAGCGKTPKIAQPSLTKVKAELIAYIEEKNLSKPTLIGHSLGGFMGFWLASSYPDQIGDIISVDGLPFIGPVFSRTNKSTVESMAPQALQIKQMYNGMTVEQMIAQARYSLDIQATSDEAKAQVINMVKTSDPKTTGNAIVTLLKTDLRHQLHRIKSRILLLGASGGFTKPDEHASIKQLYQEQLADAANATLKMNTRAKHFIMLDDSAWLNQQVQQFLDE